MRTFLDFLKEAYGKGYVSPWAKIEKATGKKLSSGDEFRKKMKDLDDQYKEIQSRDPK